MGFGDGFAYSSKKFRWIVGRLYSYIESKDSRRNLESSTSDPRPGKCTQRRVLVGGGRHSAAKMLFHGIDIGNRDVK